MKAHEFDRAFDDAEDVSAHVDWSGAERVNLGTRRVNVDFPAWGGRRPRPAGEIARRPPGSRSSSSGSPTG